MSIYILVERTPGAGQFAGSAGRGWRMASILGVSPSHPLFPLSCGVALRLSPGLLPAPEIPTNTGVSQAEYDREISLSPIGKIENSLVMMEHVRQGTWYVSGGDIRIDSNGR